MRRRARPGSAPCRRTRRSRCRRRRGRRRSRASPRWIRSAAGTSACSGWRPSPAPTPSSPAPRRRPARCRAPRRAPTSSQRLVDVLGQALALHRRAEHVRAEDLVAGEGQVERAERAAVGAPLCGGDVLLACPGHGGLTFLLVAIYERAPEAGWGVAVGRRRPALRRPTPPGIGPTMNRRPLGALGYRSTGEILDAIFRQRAKCGRDRHNAIASAGRGCVQLL